MMFQICPKFSNVSPKFSNEEMTQEDGNYE